MSEWQEISSAPKDGHVFLALNNDTEVFASRYSKTHRQFTYRMCQQRFPEKYTGAKLADGTYGMVRDEEFSKKSAHFAKEWILWSAMYEFKPTHWMPLPKPPVNP